MYRTVLSVALASIFSTASISAVAADQVKGFYVGAGYRLLSCHLREI